MDRVEPILGSLPCRLHRTTGPWWSHAAMTPVAEAVLPPADPLTVQPFFRVLWIENQRWARAESEARLPTGPRRAPGIDLLA